MKNRISIPLIAIMLFLIQSSCCNKCDPKCDECPSTPCPTTLCPEARSQNTTLAFDTYDAGYTSKTGFYNRKMWIPEKYAKNNQGRNTQLELRIENQRDISKYGNYIIFENFMHHQTDRRSLTDSLKSISNTGNLTHIIGRPILQSGKNVYIISYHDEDYPTYHDTIKVKIDSLIQEAIKICVSQEACNFNDKIGELWKTEPTLFKIFRPNTIGGGVIPPK